MSLNLRLKKIILNTLAVLSFAFVALIIVLVAYEGLLYYAHDMSPDYALIDRCDDLGGQWESEARTCLTHSPAEAHQNNDQNKDLNNHALPQSGTDTP